MNRARLDQELVNRGLARTRSQAENYIKLGQAEVNGQVVTKPGANVPKNAVVKLTAEIKYVSRGALKLESVADTFSLDFRGKAVLDVGSSTGGFTDFALQHGAAKVIAVEAGKQQMDEALKLNKKIELHEQTDVRNIKGLSTKVDYCLIDVSFISIRTVLEHLLKLLDKNTQVIAMVKPQFEASAEGYKHKGVIKNEAIRRQILKDFEEWVKNSYKIINKADSKVKGPKGNVERFYLLKLLAR